jgi:hypothetical protein
MELVNHVETVWVIMENSCCSIRVDPVAAYELIEQPPLQFSALSHELQLGPNCSVLNLRV